MGIFFNGFFRFGVVLSILKGGIHMKRLMLMILIATAPLAARDCDTIDDLAQNTDALYREGACAGDGAYTALGLSMLGWGAGLAVGIGVLAAVLHQSTAHSH